MSEMTRPAGDYLAVTKSDTVNLTKINGLYPRGFYIGGAGDIVLVSASGNAVTFTAPAGVTLPFQAVRVNSTNTDATNIVALY